MRNAVLRLLFLMALPLVVLGHPRWSEGPAAALHIAGTFYMFAAILGRFWATLYIGGHKNGRLTREGLYSLCLHPLYLFSIIGITSFGPFLESLTLALLFGVTVAIVLTLIAHREERFLNARSGPAMTSIVPPFR